MKTVKRWISEERLNELEELGRLARGDILKMTTLASSGHPGGSMSSIDIYLALFSFARVDPNNPWWGSRDRIVISHGHTSPGVYVALGRLRFFNIDEAIATFRLAGSRFEGHVERSVPGVEWSTGNLGQGLSAGCGFAAAGRVRGEDFNVFVVMSDAEQAKGQVSEARRFAHKYGFSNITVIIDYNERQISGKIHEVMPVNIRDCYISDGWKVIETDGHDMKNIRNSLDEAVNDGCPTAIIAKTVMGKGVSFMEGKEEYHGRALKMDEYKRAIQELGLKDDLEWYKELRRKYSSEIKSHAYKMEETNVIYSSFMRLKPGLSRTYQVGSSVETRQAFGNALADIAEAQENEKPPIAVFDCDLAESVRTLEFAKKFPENFFEVGVQEHTTATIAGAASIQGLVPFFVDFGVFGVDETYNQHRLNDINSTNLKVIVTHCGLNVGEDGKTHHCIDYVGVIRNLFGFKVIVPADANQTDRATRYIASNPGNFLLAVGRSKLPVISDEYGKEAFAGDYEFRYGRTDVLRRGKDAAIFTMGSLVHKAIEAWRKLKESGIEAMVVNVSSPLEIDEVVLEGAAKTGVIVTYEDHNVNTGLGASVLQSIAERGYKVKVKRMGIREYGSSGTFEDLYEMANLDETSLIDTVSQLIYS
ncbi:MAG: transketolase [Thermoproteota archaeon]